MVSARDGKLGTEDNAPTLGKRPVQGGVQIQPRRHICECKVTEAMRSTAGKNKELEQNKQGNAVWRWLPGRGTVSVEVSVSRREAKGRGVCQERTLGRFWQDSAREEA